MVQQKKNLSFIQVLRGIASLLVVLFHVTATTNDSLKKDFCFNFFSFGGAGVDIFFVLSGFIITYTNLNGITKIGRLRTFIKKRIIRIFPIYWITITFFLLIQISLPQFYKTHFDLSATNFISTYLLLPGHNMINGVSWTLTYEVFFYLVFSFAFIITNKKVLFAFTILAGISIIITSLFGFNAEDSISWMGLLVFPMNIEFILGILAALVISKLPIGAALPFIIAGVLLFLVFGILSNLHYYIFINTFNRVVFFGIPSFFIITGLVKFELTRNIVMPGLPMLLGESSYSLYLLHLPVIAACVKIIARFNTLNGFVLHSLLFVMIGVIAYGSILFYRCIEKPIINTLNARRL